MYITMKNDISGGSKDTFTKQNEILLCYSIHKMCATQEGQRVCLLELDK